uniref:CX domain-containing protein n=1 Tax=Rhabditophanes sp. KR3021 TaxID=114890 RepID=A0AC35U684_9BILA
MLALKWYFKWNVITNKNAPSEIEPFVIPQADAREIKCSTNVLPIELGECTGICHASGRSDSDLIFGKGGIGEGDNQGISIGVSIMLLIGLFLVAAYFMTRTKGY